MREGEKEGMEITINGKKLIVPQTWDELNIYQIEVFIRWVFLNNKKIFKLTKEGIEVIDAPLLVTAKIALLRALLPIRNELFKKISEEDIHALIFTHGVVDFFFANSNFTKQPLPEIKIDKITLYGPSDQFDNLRMGEFVFAEQAYLELTEEITDDKLNTLMAILFRHKTKGYDPNGEDAGDCRIKFTPFSIDTRKTLFTEVSVYHKIAVYLWYQSCRDMLSEIYPEPFEGDPDSNTGEPPRLIDILITAVDNDMTRIKDAEQTLVHIAFATMSKNIRDAKKQLETFNQRNNAL